MRCVTFSCLLACGLMTLALSGCNAGLAGVLVAVLLDDDDSSHRAAPSTVEFLELRDARTQTSRAVIRVLLANDRSRPGDLFIEVAPAGGDFQPATLVPPLPGTVGEPGQLEDLETSPDGVPHDIGWNAEQDLGSDALAQATLRLTADQSDPVLVDVVVGNDPPAILSVELDAIAGGLVEVDVTLADSSSDPVDVVLEYALPPEGADPPEFTPGTIIGSATGLESSPDGITHSFEWDSLADLGPLDRVALLRLTPADTIEGSPGKVGEPVVEQVELDNNGAPQVQILEEGLLTAPDRRGGLGLGFLVRDPEADPVDVIIQWTTAGEPFPELPDTLDASADAREALLSDPVESAIIQVVRLRSEVLEGTVEMPQDGVALLSSELLATWLSDTPPLLALRGPGALPGRPVEVLPAGGGPVRSGWVCGYTPESGVLEIEPPPDPPASPGDAIRIDLGGAGGPLRLASSPEGVLHRLIWDSGTVAPGGGVYRLRITPYDRAAGLDAQGCGDPSDPVEPGAAPGDRGLPDATLGAKEILGPFRDAQPRILGLGPLDRPSALSSADVDGDGRLDLACANTFSNTVLLFLQTAPDAFDQLRLADSRMQGPRAIVATDLEATAGGQGEPENPEVDLAVVGTASRNVLLMLQRPGRDFFTMRRVLTSPNLVQPDSLAVADLDDDGDRDLIVGDSATTDAALTVFLRDPSGEDGYSPVLLDDPAGNEPVTDVVAGDLVGDDGLDLAVCGAGFFKVYSVTFPPGGGAPTSVVTRVDVPGSHLSGVAVVDVDSNGRLDLAGCDRRDPSLVIVLQDDNGDFGEPERMRSRGLRGPEALITDDFDHNGVPDFALADPGEPSSLLGGGVHVFLGTPEGRYSSSRLQRPLSPERIPASPTAVLSVDLDEDGLSELVAANDGARELALYPFGAEGAFLDAPVVVGAGQGVPEPSSVAAADLDGDGRVDLLGPSLAGNNVTWFRQSDSGAFAAFVIDLSQGVAQGPIAVAAGDLSGDGRADLVTVNFDSDNLSVIYQNEEGDFTRERTLSATGLQGPVSVAISDVNGDGMPDVVTAGNLSGDLRWFAQEEDGSFQEAGVLRPDPASGIAQEGPAQVIAEDLNRDGRSDLAVACEISGNVVIYLQIAERGQFDAPFSVELAEGSVPVSLVAGDLDDDGLVDLVTADFGASRASVLHQTGGGQYDVTALAGNPGENVTGIDIGDFNRDGRADLALSIGGEIGSGIRVYYQGENGEFDATHSRLLEAFELAAPVAVLAVDLDRDGNDDLVSANRQSADVTVFFGDR